MRNDQIFVLLLVIILPMSGCFDGAVGDAEGTDDATDGATDGTTVINNYHNNTTIVYNESSDSQQRVWHSIGEVVLSKWTDGQNYYASQQRCLEYGPSYDPDNGSYLGEECKRFGYPESAEDWDSTNCSGALTLAVYGGFFGSSTNWRNGPYCEMELASITTNSGEALILRQMSGLYLRTTCDGYEWQTTHSSISNGGSGLIISGSALDCTHSVQYTTQYTLGNDYSISDLKMLSLVYEIQDTVVV